MAFALHDDLHDTTFDAAPLLRRYPLQLTRLEGWIAEHCAAPAAHRAGSAKSVAPAAAA